MSSKDLDFDDELIWESYSQEDEEYDIEGIKDALSDLETSREDIMDYFEVDKDTLNDIESQLRVERDRIKDEGDRIISRERLDKEELSSKKLGAHKDLPTYSVTPRDEWHYDRKTTKVPDVKPQKRRIGKKIQ